MFDEDLTVFFNTADFAVVATLADSSTINVIFDRAWLEQLGIVSGTNPVALAMKADADALATNATLTIAGTDYVVVDKNPVDDGATVLLQLRLAGD